MGFINSILLGSPAHYSFFGTEVEFSADNNPPLIASSAIGQLALRMIYAKPIAIVRQGYLHAFVHGMSHALTLKLLANERCKLVLFQGGNGDFRDKKMPSELWKKNIVYISGPLVSMAFYVCQLLAIAALKNYIPQPVAIALSGITAVSMTGELLVNFASSTTENDLGPLAKSNTGHLLLAIAALTGVYALGIFGAVKLLR